MTPALTVMPTANPSPNMNKRLGETCFSKLFCRFSCLLPMISGAALADLVPRRNGFLECLKATCASARLSKDVALPFPVNHDELPPYRSCRGEHP
jgi:hypothetical protein